MKNFDEYGLNAKVMSSLSGINYTKIKRELSNKGFLPLPSSSTRNARYSIEDGRKLLTDLYKASHPVSAESKIHSFFNFKGGTGKTSVCYQVATHLALCGYKILVVDTDQQGNTTGTLGYSDNTKLLTLYDGIDKNLKHEEIIQKVFDGLDLIPANFSLVHLEKVLRDKTGREFAIKKYLSPLVNEYDFIFFDCNPSVSHINRSVLTFSNQINIVTETHPYSLQVLPVLMADTQSFFQELGEQMPKVFIIPNKYEDRSTTSAEAMGVLVQLYSEYLEPDFAVRKSEDFLKSAKEQLPIAMFCKSNSIAFEDIADLTKIIIKQSAQSEDLFAGVA